MPARLDIIGHRYGRLVAVERKESRGRCTMWLCKCDCGAETVVMTQSLRSGLTRSCGCLQIGTAALLAGRVCKTHGMRQSPEYSVWCGIKRRCQNKNEACYPRYGGAGVQCLYDGFEAFFADVGPRPSAAHQIDRIDSAGSYEPGNCRWVTVTQQQRNRKSNLIIDHQGQSKCLAQWCDDLGLNYKQTWYRLQIAKWPVDRALGVA